MEEVDLKAKIEGIFNEIASPKLSNKEQNAILQEIIKRMKEKRTVDYSLAEKDYIDSQNAKDELDAILRFVTTE